MRFLAVLLLAVGGLQAAAEFDGAHWIWHDEGAGLNAPAGQRWFRTQFNVPPGSEGAAVTVSATADNLYTLYLNGSPLLARMSQPDAWSQPGTKTVTAVLRPGANCLGALAENTLDGAAGLLVKLAVTTAEGDLAVVSDDTWRSALREEPGWSEPGFDDRAWAPVRVHGPFGMAPWGTMGLPLRPPVPLDWSASRWIWSNEARQPLPAGFRYFRQSFDAPEALRGWRAEAIATCDNVFTLYLNGQRIGRGSEWKSAQRFDLTAALQPGRNELAVAALNTLEGPAGLLVGLVLHKPGEAPRRCGSDAAWRWSAKAPDGWRTAAVEDWSPARELGPVGSGPWGELAVPAAALTAASAPLVRITDFTDPLFARPLVLVQGYLPAGSTGQNFIQNLHDSRAYTEFDTPSPAALGRRLLAVTTFRPGGRVTVLADAGSGCLGSPTISYDGATVYFTMAREGEPYFHVWAVGVDGRDLRQVTQGACHDFDPVELPDGRLAFSSTRLGTAEEYHGVAAFALFSCAADGSAVWPLTSHIVGDREPRVTADGSLVFIRCDNFLERAKVETQLHRTRLNGCGGVLALGPDRPPIAFDRPTAAEQPSSWLRVYGAGVPLPLPDGRIAGITEQGLMAGATQRGQRLGHYVPYDASPLPDGRLLCTDRDQSRVTLLTPGGKPLEVLDSDTLALPPLEDPRPGLLSDALHSVLSASPRPRPTVRPSEVDPQDVADGSGTGFLYCQNVRNTRHQSADVARIRAVRIYEGRPFTNVPTQSIYMHIGTTGRELGTVPLAPDGSLYVEVPADRALSMQAVDAAGRPVISELSWVYVRPGEHRSCVGCHAASDSSPPRGQGLALRNGPVRLADGALSHRFRANNAANGGVLNQQLDRFRECASIDLYRQPATAGDLPAGRDANLRAAASELTAADPTVRRAAALRLGALRDPAGSPLLTTRLTDESSAVRLAAAMALATVAQPAAAAPLQQALEDPQPLVAQAAAVALEQLRGEGPPFDPFEQRAVGVAAWQRLTKTPPRLADGLASADRLVVAATLEALGHGSDPAATPALLAWVETHGEAELRLLLTALRALGTRGDRVVVPLLTRVLHANLQPGAGHGHQEFGYRQRPVHVAAAAAEALGHLGGPAAEQALLGVWPKLRPFEEYTLACGDHPWLMGCHVSPLHYRLVEALDAQASGAAGPQVPALVRALPMDKDRALLFELDSYETLTARVIARSGRAPEVLAACLRLLGDVTATPPADLATVVGDSPHAEVHIRRHTPPARAAQVLSVVALDPALAPRLLPLLRSWLAQPVSEERSWVLFFLLRTLGHLGDPDAAPLLREVLQSPNEASFGFNPPPHHWVFRAMNPFHRAAAAAALGQCGSAADAPLLTAVLKDLGNAPGVRDQAALALGRLLPPERHDELRTLAADYPEWAVRRTLQEAAR